ncbi:ROK family protein [Ileibacterium valens]|uniref:ROK family protein n=1 Tax=Ileibacterium valens TaxID=1862668 RepID=UPI002354A5F7|nr:ROK family protein [Ileibacterium valens]
MSRVLCFDIGGTFVKYGLIQEGKMISSDKFPTDRSDGQAVLASMKEIIQKNISSGLDGISISSPGFADNQSGKIVSGNVIEGFNGLDIRKTFEEEFGLKTALENDANCAALAEFGLGNGQGVQNLAVMTLGTGVGGGIILNGKLHNGNRNMAGEFGFMFIHGIHTKRPEDEILSGHASTRALCEDVSKPKGYAADGFEVFRLFEENDPQAQIALDHFLDSLAMSIYNIAYIIAPEKVLIGGGISEQKMILPEVKKRVSALTPSFSVDLNEIMEIDTCAFGNDAGLFGAYVNFEETYPER